MRQLFFLLLSLLVSGIAGVGFGQTTWYVDSSNVEGPHDGMSWETAYSNLESAIYNSELYPGDSIFVAKGTYQHQSVGGTYYLNKSEIHIFGGFPVGGSTFTDRNWEEDSTILKMNGSKILGIDEVIGVELDGLYFEGNPDELSQTGVSNNSHNSALRNIVIFNCFSDHGGGMYNVGENLILENVVFKNNKAIREGGYGGGGGFQNEGNGVQLENVVFEGNYAEGSLGVSGGGMGNHGHNVILKNVQFIENSVYCENELSLGGALENSGKNMMLEDVVFYENIAFSENGWVEGGAFRHQGGVLNMKNVSFSNNKAESSTNTAIGGGMITTNSFNGTILMNNVTFEQNKALGGVDGEGGVLSTDGVGRIILNNVSFAENEAFGVEGQAAGGAFYNRVDTLELYHSSFIENLALSEQGSARGGGLYATSSSNMSKMIAENVKFIENKSIATIGISNSGGFHNAGVNDFSFIDCVFSKNNVYGSISVNSGGAFSSTKGLATVINSVFSENIVVSENSGNSYGGGILFAGTELNIMNSTFYKNQVVSNNLQVGGAIVNASDMYLNNSMLWDNVASEGAEDVLSLGTININHSYTQSDFSTVGTGNIQGVTSPFIDSSNPEGEDGVFGTLDDGLALVCGSASIDVGDNNFLDGDSLYDITGSPRVDNGTVDMGAYEYHGVINDVVYGEVCSNNPYTWNSEDYTIPGSYYTVIGQDGNGCDIVDVLVLTNDNSISITPATQNNNICINTAFTTVVYTTLNANEVEEVYGLPDGVEVQYNNNAILLTGTPTEAGEFLYAVKVKGCGEEITTGKIEILPVGQVQNELAEPLTLCKGSFFDDVILSTDHIDDLLTFDGFPEGIEPVLLGTGVYFIGTPTETGEFNYSITFSGCENIVYQGVLTVVEDNEILDYDSEIFTCVNTSVFETITHQVIGVMTGIKEVIGLPDGMSFNFDNEMLVLSGAPTEIGTFNYTVIPLEGCDEITGTVHVHGATVVEGATQYPTVCVNNGEVEIFHFVQNVMGIGVGNNLPDGVTADFLGDVIKIHGIPTEEGVFNYSIDVVGGCDYIVTTGTITVVPEATVQQNINATTCIGEEMTSMVIEGQGLLSLEEVNGLPQGVSVVLSGDEITISGTPTEAGVFEYQISIQTNCDNIQATGTLNVTSNYIVESNLEMEEVCLYSLMNPIIHLTVGVDAIDEVVGMPEGVIASLTNGVLVISGTPVEKGTFEYTITFESDLCGSAVAEGTIVVNDAPAIDLGGNQIFCEDEEINITLDAGEADSYLWNTGETTSTIHVEEAGLYSVATSNENGCEANGTVEIIVNETPTVSVELLEGNILKATASFVEYQWINCDTNEPIEDETESVFIPTENGNYAVMVVGQTGCETISECITVSTVGLEMEELTNLIAYPNPTFNGITLDFGKTIDTATLELLDLTGKRLQQEIVTNVNEYKISLNHLARGVYLIDIQIKDQEQQIIKIIKE